MPEDRVTLRDIMRINEEMKECIEALEKKIDSKVSFNAKEIVQMKIDISELKNKVSNSSKITVTISIVLGAIATYVATRGGV